MRYGIFSDVHSNLEALEAVEAAYKEERIDTYLCVGDIVGYGTNPTECVKKVKALEAITVAGNHDWASVGLLSPEYFNPYAKEALAWTKEKISEEDKIFLSALKLVYREGEVTLVHGTLHSPGDFDYMHDTYAAHKTFILMQTGICFVGHTHKAGIFIKGPRAEVEYSDAGRIRIEPRNKYIINTGSVGQPRDGNPDAAYCIYDTAEREVRIERVSYDSSRTRKKIIDSGLPEFLGDRLLTGR